MNKHKTKITLLRPKQQKEVVFRYKSNVYNSLNSEAPFVSLSEQLLTVVTREFEKIKANLA